MVLLSHWRRNSANPARQQPFVLRHLLIYAIPRKPPPAWLDGCKRGNGDSSCGGLPNLSAQDCYRGEFAHTDTHRDADARLPHAHANANSHAWLCNSDTHGYVHTGAKDR